MQKEMKREKEKVQQKAKKRFSWAKMVFWFLSIPGLIILGALLHYLFPRHTEAVVGTLSVSPLNNLGIGLVFLVVVPVAILICLITLVGIPTGIIAGLLYGIAIYISRIYIGVWIGRKLLGAIKKSLATAYFWPLVVGVIFIALVGLIPFLGWLFRLFLLLITLGALWMAIWRSIQGTMGKKEKAFPSDAV